MQAPSVSIIKLTNGERVKSKKMSRYEQDRAEYAAEYDEMRMFRSRNQKIVKAYNQDHFCDVNIKAKDDVVIKAHKLMLAISSHYFNKMFKPEGEWEKLTDVTISEFDGVVVQAIVDCIYTQRVKRSVVTKENSKQMLKAGILFDVETVKEEAAMYMVRHLDESNAIDLLIYDIFTGPMANNAFKYIGENFQVFLDDAELKKRLLTEMNVDTIINLLQQKYLMLWHPNGIYLDGIERETKLFDFLMEYVSHDKEVRLPELSRLLKALKLPILAVSKLLTVDIMGERLKFLTGELSDQLADVLEPFDDITGKENLSTMFVTERKSKDKERSATATRALAETCKMRFATIPHSTSCSDLILAHTPFEDRPIYCPEKTDNTVIHSTTKMIKSITISKPNLSKLDLTKVVKDITKNLQVNGVRIKWDDDSEESLGSKDDENNVLETYTLDEGVLITEMMTYHQREVFSGKKPEHEFEILNQMHDVAFMTNKEKLVGPMSSSQSLMDVGLRLKVPTRIRSLEYGCPGIFYWLQGFGMEELEDESGKVSSNCFYPIWGFQTHFKCYELSNQDFEFVAGTKKCYQFSVEGISEYPMIKTKADIDSLERTPVHEVVDLGDSDDEEPEAGPSNTNDDSIMMIDSDSEHTEDGSEEEEEDSDDDYDEDDHARLLRAGILEVESGEDVGHGTDSPFNADILDEDDDDENVGQPKNFASECIEIPSSSEPDVDPPNMEDVSEEMVDEEKETDKTGKEGKSKDKTAGKKSPTKVDKKKKSSEEEETVEISKMDDNKEKADDSKSAKEKSKSSSKEEDTVEISKKDDKEEKADDTKTVKGKGKGKGKTPVKNSTNKEKDENNTETEKELEKEDAEKENKVEDKSDDSKPSRSKRGKPIEEEKEVDDKKKTKENKDAESTEEKESPSKKKSKDKTGKDENSTKDKDEKESPLKKKAKGKVSEEKEEEPKTAKRSRGKNSVSEEKEEEAKTSKRRKR